LMLGKIIRENAIDIVISDNRFGLWNKKVTSVYVTHMPRIPFPKPFRFLEFIGIFIHRAVIRKYSFCFIPDLPGDLNISGRLSHGIRLPENVRYIGILSRFPTALIDKGSDPSLFRHNTVILSGPEPQKGIMKQKLVKILIDKDPVTVILEGRPDKEINTTNSGNIRFYSHLLSSEMENMIRGSNSVITRSGYSTIMDLISLNCCALLIPTPGQTEQEYLAEYLSEKGWFPFIKQSEISAKLDLPSINCVWTDELIKQSEVLLDKALAELLRQDHKKG
jgi:UDP-N-acetylglucosamine transferase subunit ALG13